MSSIQITSSSSPPLIASKTSHIQMAVPQPITKFMVSINQSGQTILPMTSGIQPPPASSIYVVGQAAASRLQYVNNVGNIGSSLSSNISFATNFDPPHSLTMPQKLASRIPLSKPRLALPAQHLGDQRHFFSTDLKNPALISSISSKNAPIVSSLMPISKQGTNVTASPSNPNPSFISPTQQKLLLPQSRAANITRNPLPASAIALSINQQKSLAINWSSASPSIIPLAQLISKTSSGHLHHEQLTQRAQGQPRPENHTLLIVANPFPQQQPKMLSPILSGPINLSTQSNKNSVQSQALNLTINRQQQAIILTSTPASLRTSIPISTNLVINKLGSPINGINLTRPKKNIRLNPASTTTILNQHASLSNASKQAHTVVSIQPVSSQIVQQSQPHSNFTPIAKVTPQLHLFQQQQLQQQQLQQQQIQNQIFQNHHQSIQLFQSQQQLQNQQHLQNQQAMQNQQLQNHQLQNQQQNLQLLQSQQQMQNQQALQSIQGQQHLQTQQQKLQQHLLQQPKVSTVASFNSSITPIRLQSSQLGRMSEGVQLLSPTAVSLSMIAAGLPFSLANEQNILQIDRGLTLKGLSAEEESGSRLMHVSMEQLTNRSNHHLSNPMTHTVTQASIGLMLGQPNLSQAIHQQNTKARQQNMVSQSGICFPGAVVSSGKLQPYFTNLDSPKAIVNFHVSAAPSTPEAGVLSQVLLTSSIFQQHQQQGGNDVIIKQQQLPPPQNSSPRPSILRKTVDVFVNPNIRKNLISHLSTSQNIDILPHNEAPVIVTNTQITPIEIIRENSQSSTDTASPSEGLVKPNLKPNVHENGTLTNKINNTCKLIPRKKPRKQSLHMCPDAAEIGELIADEIVMADDDADAVADENDATEADDENEQSDVLNDEKSSIEININDSDINEYIDKNGHRWTLEKKRPNITMSQQYHCSWKPKYNHFNSISDVKPKEEKRQTLNEIANQRNIQEKISGSKLYLIAAQFDQLRDGEQEMEQQLRKFKDSLLANNENKFKLSDEELSNLEELIMSNIQRSQTCASQYDDVTDLLLKLVERKTKVSEILNKHQSKRTSKKKKVPTATLR